MASKPVPRKASLYGQTASTNEVHPKKKRHNWIERQFHTKGWTTGVSQMKSILSQAYHTDATNLYMVRKDSYILSSIISYIFTINYIENFAIQRGSA